MRNTMAISFDAFPRGWQSSIQRGKDACAALFDEMRLTKQGDANKARGGWSLFSNDVWEEDHHSNVVCNDDDKDGNCTDTDTDSDTESDNDSEHDECDAPRAGEERRPAHMPSFAPETDDVVLDEIVRQSKIQSRMIITHHLEQYLADHARYESRSKEELALRANCNNADSLSASNDSSDNLQLKVARQDDESCCMKEARGSSELCGESNASSPSSAPQHDDSGNESPATCISTAAQHPTFEDWIEQLFPDNVVMEYDEFCGAYQKQVDARLYWKESVVIVVWNQRVPKCHHVQPADDSAATKQ